MYFYYNCILFRIIWIMFLKNFITLFVVVSDILQKDISDIKLLFLYSIKLEIS